MNGEKLTSKHFEKMFESIPTVSMSVFSWFKHSECPYITSLCRKNININV